VLRANTVGVTAAATKRHLWTMNDVRDDCEDGLEITSPFFRSDSRRYNGVCPLSPAALSYSKKHVIVVASPSFRVLLSSSLVRHATFSCSIRFVTVRCACVFKNIYRLLRNRACRHRFWSMKSCFRSCWIFQDFTTMFIVLTSITFLTPYRAACESLCYATHVFTLFS